ncbi:RNA polymerase sigma factor [Anaerosporobacter faecicola]|uniref:RNA polymerase sigma factor n=1 Tax=Anaerosporobacter faecicola TaxID=2718714 RepID=UPI00143B83B3|nr:sigma-70 family RNA polymerase sigma factor [Anaerosporobacter faecicola]
MEDFEEIYITYFNDVFHYLRSLTLNEVLAEELTEETFFKAMQSMGSFRGECDVRVWLCQIGKNLFYNYCRKQKKIKQEEMDENIPDVVQLEQLLVNKEQAYQIHKILHELPEPYKEVFSLRVFGELSFQKIGLLFGKSEHWACVTFHRGKQKIQKMLIDRS